MATIFKHRRGTTSELSSQTGAVGELFVDLTKKTVVVMDGSTLGGMPLATSALATTSSSGLMSAADKSKLDGLGGSGITDIVNDTTPQLGGDLDLQSFKITSNTGHVYVKSQDLTVDTGSAYANRVYIKGGTATTNDPDAANIASGHFGGSVFIEGGRDTRPTIIANNGIRQNGRVYIGLNDTYAVEVGVQSVDSTGIRFRGAPNWHGTKFVQLTAENQDPNSAPMMLRTYWTGSRAELQLQGSVWPGNPQGADNAEKFGLAGQVLSTDGAGRLSWVDMTGGTANVDLTNYYTKSETDTAISTAVAGAAAGNVDLTGYATESYVTSQIAALSDSDNQTLTLSNNMLSISGGNSVDLSGYATQNYVNTQIANASLSGGNVDLSGYVTTNTAQTVYNKTLVSPVITGPVSITTTTTNNSLISFKKESSELNDATGTSNPATTRAWIGVPNYTNALVVMAPKAVNVTDAGGNVIVDAGGNAVVGYQTFPAIEIAPSTVIGEGTETRFNHSTGGTPILINRAGTVETYSIYSRGDITVDPSKRFIGNGSGLTNLPAATTSVRGTVRPDGTTITIDADGIISAVGGTGGGNVSVLPATPSVQGVVYGSTTTDMVAFGYQAGDKANASALGSTFIGLQAGGALGTGVQGINNVAVGKSALARVTTGIDNCAIGTNSLGFTTTARGCMALGSNALLRNTSGNYNTGLGVNAGVWVNGQQNIAIGWAAMAGWNSGEEGNTIVGNYNIGIGSNSLGRIYGAGQDWNIAIGIDSAPALETGLDNTVIGGNAAKYLLTGNKNTIIGRAAGNNLVNGSNNIAIGFDAQFSSNAAVNEITIGNNAVSRLRIPGLGLDTASATSGQVLGWNGTQFAWLANGTGGVDLTNYYTKSETDSAISTAIAGVSGGSGITDIVNDTTPQLGGDLDLQSFKITSDTGHVYVKSQDLTVDTGGVTANRVYIKGGTATTNDPDAANIASGHFGGSVYIEGGRDTRPTIIANSGIRQNGRVYIGLNDTYAVELGTQSADSTGVRFRGAPNWHGIKFVQLTTPDGDPNSSPMMLRTYWTGSRAEIQIQGSVWPGNPQGADNAEKFGLAGQVLSTNGAGRLSWVDMTGGTGNVDLTNYYTKSEVYTKSETDTAISTAVSGVSGGSGAAMVSTKVQVTANGQTGTVKLVGSGTQADIDAVTVTPSADGSTITISNVAVGLTLTSVTHHQPFGFNSTTAWNLVYPENFGATTLIDSVFPTGLHFNAAGVVQSATFWNVSNNAGTMTVQKTNLTASTEYFLTVKLV